MPLVTDEAFVISASDWHETSRIIRCFARAHGRIAIVAKGIRKPKSRIGSTFETFSRVQIVFYFRIGAEIFTLKEAETVEYVPELRTDLRRFAIASFYFEILDRGLPLHERHEDVFEITRRFLSDMRLDGWRPGTAPAYFLHLVTALGFAPRLDRCAVCGQPADVAFFDPAKGGGVCDSCKPHETGLIPLSSGLRDFMLTAMAQKGEEVLPVTSENAASEFFNLIRRFLEYHFETELKSAGFLLQQVQKS